MVRSRNSHISEGLFCTDPASNLWGLIVVIDHWSSSRVHVSVEAARQHFLSLWGINSREWWFLFREACCTCSIWSEHKGSSHVPGQEDSLYRHVTKEQSACPNAKAFWGLRWREVCLHSSGSAAEAEGVCMSPSTEAAVGYRLYRFTWDRGTGKKRHLVSQMIQNNEGRRRIWRRIWRRPEQTGWILSWSLCVKSSSSWQGGEEILQCLQAVAAVAFHRVHLTAYDKAWVFQQEVKVHIFLNRWPWTEG